MRNGYKDTQCMLGENKKFYFSNCKRSKGILESHRNKYN
jgi:hypothetical protein